MSALAASLGGGSLAFYGSCATGKTVALRGLARKALAAGHRVLVIETMHDGVEWVSENTLGLKVATTLDEAVTALRELDDTEPTLLIADDLHVTLLPDPVPRTLPADDPDVVEVKVRNAARDEVERLIRNVVSRPAVRLAVAMQRTDSTSPAGKVVRDLDFSPVLMLSPGHLPLPEILLMAFGAEYEQAKQAVEVLTVTDRGVGLVVVGGRVKPVRFPFIPWWEPVA